MTQSKKYSLNILFSMNVNWVDENGMEKCTCADQNVVHSHSTSFNGQTGEVFIKLRLQFF